MPVRRRLQLPDDVPGTSGRRAATDRPTTVFVVTAAPVRSAVRRSNELSRRVYRTSARTGGHRTARSAWRHRSRVGHYASITVRKCSGWLDSEVKRPKVKVMTRQNTITTRHPALIFPTSYPDAGAMCAMRPMRRFVGAQRFVYVLSYDSAKRHIFGVCAPRWGAMTPKLELGRDFV